MLYKTEFATVEYVAEMVNKVALRTVEDAKRIDDIQDKINILTLAVSALLDKVDELRSDDKTSKQNPKTITELWLSNRITNTLHAEGIFLVSQLEQMSNSDLYKIPNLGKKSIREINEALKKENEISS